MSVLMMPPSISDYCLEVYCGDGFLGCGDDEVRVSRMGREGMARACAKAGLLDDDYLDQQKCRKLHVECTSSLGRELVNVSLVLLVLAAG